MRKSLLSFAGIAVIATSVNPVVAQEEVENYESLPAVIVFTTGGAQQRRNVYLLSESDGRIIYSLNVQGTNPERLNLSQLDNIGYVLPEPVSKAMQVFDSNDYKKALPLLEKEAEWLSKLEGLPNSPYYDVRYKHIYALQETGDYDRALELYEKLDKSKLSPYQAGMLATVPAWPIYKAKQWDRLITVCEGLRDTLEDLPLAAEVRLSYLLGKAYSRDDAQKALAEYHRAMTLDAGESAELVADSAISLLEIYDRDEQVKEFFRMKGRPEFDESAGYSIPTRAAAWVAKMMDTQKPAGKDLPGDYERYLEVYKMYENDPDVGTGKVDVGEEGE